MRAWLEQHPVIVAVVCLAMIGIGLAIGLGFGRDKPMPEDEAWYYDVVEHRAFAARAKQIPPIESPWGNPGVRVFYFSCGECTPDQRFAGFYLKYSDAAKARIEANPELIGAAFGEHFDGRMYSADGENWVEAPSIAESKVAEPLRDRCPGSLRSCR